MATKHSASVHQGVSSVTNTVLRYSILIGIFIFPLIPLIVTNQFFFPFITGKNFAFRIIVELIAGLWVILAIRDHTALPKSTRILQAFAVFLGLIFISDLFFSPNVFKSFWSNFERMEGWVTLAHLFALFVVLSSVMSKKLWDWLFRASIGVSLILFVYGCLQLTGQLDIHQGTSRIDTTIGNSAYLGGYMLFHIFLALYLLIGYIRERFGTRNWHLFWPIFYSFAVLADTFILFKTATRGAEIGLVVGVVCFAIGLIVFERNHKILRRTGAGILIIIALLGGTFIIERNSSYVTHSESLSRLASFVDQLLTFDKKVICAGELKSRCLLWPMAFQGVKEKPIFGWGQESFNYVFNKYYDPKMYSQEQWFDRTHNVFFDWLIAGGILGLLSYLSLFVFGLYYLWKKGSAFATHEKTLLTGLLTAYFIHNFTVFDNITSYILFIMVLAYISSTEGQISAKLEQRVKLIDDGVKNRLIIPLVSVATIFLVYYVNVPAMLASSELIEALRGQQGGPAVNLEHFKKALSYEALGDSEIREQLIQTTSQAVGNPNVDPKVKKDFFDFANDQVKIQLTRTPEDARYFLFGGSFLASLGDLDGAIGYLTTAHELSPNKQTILFSLGSAYLGKRDFSKAVEIMKQAFDLDQTFSEARKIYAVALIYGKQLNLAQEILKPLNSEAFLADQRLISAYYSSGYLAQAVESMNFLIKADPNNPQLYFNRASIESSLGRINGAVSDLNKVIELSPSAKAQVLPLIEQVKAGKTI